VPHALASAELALAILGCLGVDLALLVVLADYRAALVAEPVEVYRHAVGECPVVLAVVVRVYLQGETPAFLRREALRENLDGLVAG
jgi:hypothetical protein